jgi:hypothetical protein
VGAFDPLAAGEAFSATATAIRRETGFRLLGYSCQGLYLMSDEDDSAPPPRSLLAEALAKRWQETAVEDKHFAAMGRVATNWAYLEALVDLRSMKLAGMHVSPGLCFTTQIFGINRKLDAFISLARLQKIPDSLVTKLNDFAREARCYGGRRDRVMHDTWEFVHPEPPERMEIMAQKRLIVRPVATPTEELIKLANAIRDLSDLFNDLAEQVSAVPRSSPEKSV